MLKKFKDYIENRKATVVKNEYIDGNGKLVEKPKVKLVADYEGPDPKAPPKPEKGEQPANYRAANAPVGAKKGEKGLADEGDSKLIYEPDTKGGNSKLTALGKEISPSWTKSESFAEKTKGMSKSEFAKYMLGECACDNSKLPKITAHEAGPFHPYPSEAIRYVAALAQQNKKFLETLIHELNRAGGMDSIVEALFNHPDSYASLTTMIQNEERKARKIAKAIEEAVAPPMGIGAGEEDEEENPSGAGEDESDDPFGDEEENSEEPEEGDDEQDFSDEDEESDEFSGEEFGDDEEEGHPLDKIGKKPMMPMPPKKKFGPPPMGF